MQALQRTTRLARGAMTTSLVKPQTFAPTLSRGTAHLTPEQIKKRDEIRRKFQQPGDTPVYLRGGVFDRVLFGFTVILVSMGAGWTFFRVYQRAQQ